MKGIDFDMRELEYLGVPVQDSTVCALRKESGITNIDQWFASKTPIKLGGLSPGNSTSDVARMVGALSTCRSNLSKATKEPTKFAWPQTPASCMALVGPGNP